MEALRTTRRVGYVPQLLYLGTYTAASSTESEDSAVRRQSLIHRHWKGVWHFGQTANKEKTESRQEHLTWLPDSEEDGKQYFYCCCGTTWKSPGSVIQKTTLLQRTLTASMCMVAVPHTLLLCSTEHFFYSYFEVNYLQSEPALNQSRDLDICGI